MQILLISHTIYCNIPLKYVGILLICNLLSMNNGNGLTDLNLQGNSHCLLIISF